MLLIADRSASKSRSTASRKEAARLDPLPVMLLRRGPVTMRSLGVIQDDHRLVLVVAEALTPEWVSLGQRVAGTLVATEDDPLRALGYAITAGLSGPIVVAMAKRYRADCKDLIAAGAIACVTMPITRTDVDRMIPLLMKHAGAARIDATLRLLLDPITRVVRYRSKHARLSQREFALLHCFSSRRGGPVSAEELLTYVWGDADSAERSRQILDVYICQLRKKLEQLGLNGAIVTVRGFGYALARSSPTALK
ncbi:MAG: winged helix-turn-helix domain-containing protein [Gemmatimonadaceae bacterium]